MKYIRVTIESYFQVPDDAEITTHPEDEFQCVRTDGECYIPTCDWLKRESSESWSSAGEEFEALAELQVEGATIEEVSKEEVESLLTEEEE